MTFVHAFLFFHRSAALLLPVWRKTLSRLLPMSWLLIHRKREHLCAAVTLVRGLERMRHAHCECICLHFPCHQCTTVIATPSYLRCRTKSLRIQATHKGVVD